MLDYLPVDWRSASLIGRMDFGEGPTPVHISGGRILDLSATGPTVSHVFEGTEPGGRLEGVERGHVGDVHVRPVWAGGSGLLAPIDLQCVKAAGVTFAASMIERVVEEASKGDPMAAATIREKLSQGIAGGLSKVRPGSEEAARLKAQLISEGLWSQYLEVAIGPDAEIFTKAPVLSSVGGGQEVGIRSDSSWNNSEPEIVLVCDSRGRIRGVTLGNDINLRDFEGRSALLLSKAKDNNASCAVGPFIRLFDDHFTLDDVRQSVVSLHVAGADGFVLEDEGEMRRISRELPDLAAQTCGRFHQYPDGFVLFCGALSAPVQDRGVPGTGFTHRKGDIVRVTSRRIGCLENRVTYCEDAPPWSFGIGALMANLASRRMI